jgi:hypothetical protein
MRAKINRRILALSRVRWDRSDLLTSSEANFIPARETVDETMLFTVSRGDTVYRL